MIRGERPPTIAVGGRVRVGAVPIEGGWIEFWPVDGTVGDLKSSPIAADGTFALAGLTPGRRLVSLVRPRVGEALPDPLRAVVGRVRGLDSPARVVIPDRSPFRLDIDLTASDILKAE